VPFANAKLAAVMPAYCVGGCYADARIGCSRWLLGCFGVFYNFSDVLYIVARVIKWLLGCSVLLFGVLY